MTATVLFLVLVAALVIAWGWFVMNSLRAVARKWRNRG